jgi:hypothetical protein
MQTVQLYGKVAAGRVALVDDKDYELVMLYRWSVIEVKQSGDRRPIPYARAYVPAVGGQKRGSVTMHNLITGIIGVDHANGNSLDNRRSNLRAATQGENTGNKRKRLSASSQYKGVSWHKRTGRWRATIGAAGQRRHLGAFVSEIDAACAYDVAAREAYGEFACVNFPQPGERGALSLPGNAGMTAAPIPAAGPFAPDRHGTSRYRGVRRDSGSRRWKARFKRIGGGHYESEVQAAIAYDVLASAALGAAADLNFPAGIDQATADRLYVEAGVTVEEARAAVGRGRTASLKASWSRREAVTLVCELCSSEYPSRATNKGRYCSRSCTDKAAYARNREAGRVLVPRREAEQAARIYAEAVASGSRAPQKAVIDRLGCSRSRASRMIRAARDLGLLGEYE